MKQWEDGGAAAEAPDWEMLAALQKKSLDILVVFREFCDRHGLLFYFCGGCCIGTLRHGGFIPWDDDVDVFMPRAHYERLAQLWPVEMAGTQYAFCRSSETTFYRSLISAVADTSTTFIKERQADLDIPHGIRLEIIPLDGCPSSRILRRGQILTALIYQIYMNQEPPTSKGKLLETVGRLLLWLAPTWKRRYRIAKWCEKRMSRFSFDRCDKTTELCSRYQYMVNEYPHHAFESAVYRSFEGLEMPIPVGYDAYLRMAFGDYMCLPPEEARIPKHEAVCVDVEHGYETYRGVYFPTGQVKADG